MKKLSLCKESCCPTVETTRGQFIIRDDIGGQVTLTAEQLGILVKIYPELRQELDQQDNNLG